MKNLKDIILEKLKISNSKLTYYFDDILPVKFSEDLFIEASHELYKSDFQNMDRYYDLENIYGDDLPSLYRSFTFADESSKCYGLFGDFDSNNPNIMNIMLVFKAKNDKMYSTAFNKINNNTLFLSLGKGDIDKGVGVLKFITDELK